MAYEFGKAFSGGTVVSEEEIREIKTEQLTALKEKYRQAAPLEKTDDVIDQRVAEEMNAARRMLEIIEAEIARRGAPESLIKRMDQIEETIEDLADIVDAKDKCEGVERADPDLKRRLKRRSLDGTGTPCDNR